MADGGGFLGTRVTILAGYQKQATDDESVDMAIDRAIVTDDVELESMRSARGVLSRRGGRIVNTSIDITGNSIVIRFHKRSCFKITSGAFTGYIIVFPDSSPSDISGAALDVRYRLNGMTASSVSTDGNKVRINLAGRVASPFSVVRINFPHPIPLGV